MSASAVSDDVVARVPSHGGGKIRPWQPGQSGNPGGRASARFREVTRLARAESVEAVRALIATFKDPNEDGRVRVVAAEAVLMRAWGKREPDVGEEQRYKLDLSRLSLEELRVILKAVERGAIELPPEQAQEAAEAVVIEGQAEAPVKP